MALIYNASFDSQTRTLSLLDKAGNVISSCEVPSKGDPLTLTATADNSSVKLTKVGSVKNAYEVNTGSGWVSYTFDTVINLNKGQSCKWRCTSHPTSFNDNIYVRFAMTGSIEASGEVYSMLSSNLSDVTTLNGYRSAFTHLFENCTALTQAPALPATNLAIYCYASMFYGCTALTQAPALPATTLKESCYRDMFNGCTSLTQAPALPATYLALNCYRDMFNGCTSLTQAPALPATYLTVYCYASMFYGCTSLTQAPALPATTLKENSYAAMFCGCTSLTQAPALPATDLENYCYYAMFNGCTSLTQAPALPATYLTVYCYASMFYGCTSLTQAPALPATILANSCYWNMFYGCTALTQAPALPATKLAKSCYQSMFDGCTSLNEVRISATTTATSATSALDNWLKDVSSTGDFYCNPNATIFPSGASGIPQNWTRHALADYPVTP